MWFFAWIGFKHKHTKQKSWSKSYETTAAPAWYWYVFKIRQILIFYIVPTTLELPLPQTQTSLPLSIDQSINQWQTFTHSYPLTLPHRHQKKAFNWQKNAINSKQWTISILLEFFFISLEKNVILNCVFRSILLSLSFSITPTILKDFPLSFSTLSVWFHTLRELFFVFSSFVFFGINLV